MTDNKKSAKSGPKSSITEWEQAENQVLLQGWKRKGLTDVEIAKNIGIGVRTLYDWKRKSPQITQVLKRGKEHANFMVESALYRKAVQGNTTAMIFWLKNNYRDKYSDNPIDPEIFAQQKRKAKAEAELAELSVKQADGSADDQVVVNVHLPEDGDSDG